MEERLKETISDVLSISIHCIDDNTTKESIPSWDSVKHINLVIALEQEFNITFDIHEIELMNSYREILSILETKAVAKDIKRNISRKSGMEGIS